MMMTVALALALTIGLVGGAGARVYSIGRLTPEVLLDGDPDYPYIANPAGPESVVEGRAPAGRDSIRVGSNTTPTSSSRLVTSWVLRVLLWRWTCLR